MVDLVVETIGISSHTPSTASTVAEWQTHGLMASHNPRTQDVPCSVCKRTLLAWSPVMIQTRTRRRASRFVLVQPWSIVQHKSMVVLTIVFDGALHQASSRQCPQERVMTEQFHVLCTGCEAALVTSIASLPSRCGSGAGLSKDTLCKVGPQSDAVCFFHCPMQTRANPQHCVHGTGIIKASSRCSAVLEPFCKAITVCCHLRAVNHRGEYRETNRGVCSAVPSAGGRWHNLSPAGVDKALSQTATRRQRRRGQNIHCAPPQRLRQSHRAYIVQPLCVAGDCSD